MSVKHREGFVTLCKVNGASFDIVHNLWAALMDVSNEFEEPSAKRMM
jgi:hypothetical protein